MPSKSPDITFFLGANTPDGFYSLFDSFLKEPQLRDVYVIKAGPGTGKSTFMKRIAAALTGKDLTIHYITCSSDPASLDGIYVPELGMAVVDGTSPHDAVTKRKHRIPASSHGF